MLLYIIIITLEHHLNENPLDLCNLRPLGAYREEKPH